MNMICARESGGSVYQNIAPCQRQFHQRPTCGYVDRRDMIHHVNKRIEPT